jgi:hypothetical protein
MSSVVACSTAVRDLRITKVDSYGKKLVSNVAATDYLERPESKN